MTGESQPEPGTLGGSNSGWQAWWQAVVPAQPFQQPTLQWAYESTIILPRLRAKYNLLQRPSCPPPLTQTAFLQCESGRVGSDGSL